MSVTGSTQNLFSPLQKAANTTNPAVVVSSAGDLLPPQTPVVVNLVAASTSLTLSAQQMMNGVFLTCPVLGAECKVALPSPVLCPGGSLKVRIVGGAALGNILLLTSALATSMYGQAYTQTDSAAHSYALPSPVIGAPSTSVSFTATAVPGDTLDIYSNGVNYFFWGQSAGATNASSFAVA